MGVRMIPVEAVLLRLPRLVRDLASRLGKEVDLELVGQETELDRTVVDAIGDPLVHLVRNALDHGLEPPEERVAAGKPPRGRLTVSARQAGSGVVIDVRDDGRGVDPARVARKAVERGLIAPGDADAVDAAGAAELIFTPGFSTAEHHERRLRPRRRDGRRARRRSASSAATCGSRPCTAPGRTSRSGSRSRWPSCARCSSAARGGTFAIPLDRVERTVRLDDHVVRSVRSRRRAPARRPRAAADLRRRVARRRRRLRRRLRRAAARPGRTTRSRCASTGSSASASSSRAPCPRSSSPTRRSPAPPCSPTATSRSSSTRRLTARRRLRRRDDPLHRAAARRPGRAGEHRLRHRRHGPVDAHRQARRHLRPARPRAADRGGGRRRRRRRPRGPRDPRPDHARPPGQRAHRSSRRRTRPRSAACSASTPTARTAPPPWPRSATSSAAPTSSRWRDARHGDRARPPETAWTCSARSSPPSCSASGEAPTMRCSWTPRCSSRARASASSFMLLPLGRGHRRPPGAAGPVTTATDIVVRMGELAVSADAGACLVTIGLGSCIGVRAGRPHPPRRRARARDAAAGAPARPTPCPPPRAASTPTSPCRRSSTRCSPPAPAASACRSRWSAAPRCSAPAPASLDVGARNEAAVRDAAHGRAAARPRRRHGGRQGQHRAGRGRIRAGACVPSMRPAVPTTTLSRPRGRMQSGNR